LNNYIVRSDNSVYSLTLSHHHGLHMPHANPVKCWKAAGNSR